MGFIQEYSQNRDGDARRLRLAIADLLCSTDAYPQAPPLLTQRERQSHAAARPNPRCKPEPYEPEHPCS